jgi:hypothetical protein
MAHGDLRTLEVHTDWDEPLVRTLGGIALFYCDEGVWEGLDEATLHILEAFKEGEALALSRPLRRAYNAFVVARQTADFDLDDEAADDALMAAEQALVAELLDYHADPEVYVIVHALDEAHGGEAWFLCFQGDVEGLGLDRAIRA